MHATVNVTNDTRAFCFNRLHEAIDNYIEL